MQSTACDYAKLAKAAVGNWMKFESFCWYDRPDDAEDWCVVYTQNRDSDLLTQSNSGVIDKAMEPHLEADEPDIIQERHGHWACGWVDGYAIRVLDSAGEPTEAFKAWRDLQSKLEDYPVLDEEDYSNREYDATIENIGGELSMADPDDEYRVPDDAAEQVWSWLGDNDPGAVENRDDQGGYPSSEQIRSALDGLGWRKE